MDQAAIETAGDFRSRDERRDAIEKEINEHLAAIAAAQARVCELVEEHLREGMWRDHDGISSESRFLSWRGGLTPRAANAYIKLSRDLTELPHLKDSFAAGKLSMSQAQVVASVATPDSDASLTELAEGLSASQLVTVAGYFRTARDADKDPGDDRYLNLRYDLSGNFRMSGKMPADQGMIIETAIQALAEHIPLDAENDGLVDPFGARRADALTLMAESVLANEIQTRSGYEAFQAVIHVDHAVLEGSSEDGDCYIQGAGAISPETARRITCDSHAMLLGLKDGKPLSAGRKTRTFKDAMRRALEAKNKMCCWPGCGNKVHLQGHHVKHWARDRGETDIDNGALLCWFHHRKVHEGRIEMVRDGEGWRFVTPDGKVIARPPPTGAGATVHQLNNQRGVITDEETCLPQWMGEPGDLRYVAEQVVGEHLPPL